MYTKKEIYKNIIKVIDTENELDTYFKLHSDKKWCFFEKEKYCYWENIDKQVIVKEVGQGYFTLYSKLDYFFAEAELFDKESNIYRESLGFSKDFNDTVVEKTNSLLKRLRIDENVSLSEEQFRKIAETCTDDNFTLNKEFLLSELTAYAGLFIMKHIPEFEWVVLEKKQGSEIGFVPYLEHEKFGRFNIHELILHSYDKHYNNEFFWGAIPLDIYHKIFEETN